MDSSIKTSALLAFTLCVAEKVESSAFAGSTFVLGPATRHAPAAAGFYVSFSCSEIFESLA